MGWWWCWYGSFAFSDYAHVKTLHTTDRKMSYWYGARSLSEVFFLEDFLSLEKEFPILHSI